MGNTDLVDPRDTVGTSPDTEHLPETVGAMVPADAPQAALAPLDLDPAVFRKALTQRKKNYRSLMKWVKSSLVPGCDYGRILIKWRDKTTGEWMQTLSKPSLWKPGAEKVCGILGLVPTFPNAEEYERAAIAGKPIKNIVIRCHLLNSTGLIVATGMGARIVEHDKGDLNKAIKMAMKSAHIDATLRCGGLSAVFTQDIEELNENIAHQDRQQGAPRSTAKRGADRVRKDYPRIDEGQLADLHALAEEAWPDAAVRAEKVAIMVGLANEKGRAPVPIHELKELPRGAMRWAVQYLEDARANAGLDDDVPY